MPNPAVIGLDIAKNVFQVHGADAEGRSCCAGGSVEPRSLCSLPDCRKFWSVSRHVRAAIIGRANFAVLATSPADPAAIRPPFRQTNKNDAADAKGICEAVVRPNMRFVPIKSVEQQAAMMLHRTRALLLRQRTQLINAVRGHLAEFGLIARRGARNIQELADLVRDTGADKLPDAARAMLVLLLEQIREAQVRVRKTEQLLKPGQSNRMPAGD